MYTENINLFIFTTKIFQHLSPKFTFRQTTGSNTRKMRSDEEWVQVAIVSKIKIILLFVIYLDLQTVHGKIRKFYIIEQSRSVVHF